MLRSLVRHPGEIVSMTHSHLEAFWRLQGGKQAAAAAAAAAATAVM